MALFNQNVTVESKARNTTQLPISEGQFLMTSDTKNVFYDLAGERIQLTDIIELDTEAQRKAILAPLNKFYFVKDTGILWRYNNGWLSWGHGGGSSSSAVHKVLTAAGWVNNQQVVSISGLTANQNGIAGLSQDISQAEFEAAANAEMRICAQADGSFTVVYHGDKPGCDIPITIIILD